MILSFGRYENDIEYRNRINQTIENQILERRIREINVPKIMKFCQWSREYGKLNDDSRFTLKSIYAEQFIETLVIANCGVRVISRNPEENEITIIRRDRKTE